VVLARVKQRRRPHGPRLRSIEIQRASVRLGRHWALRDVSFVLRAGERWLVTGPNGAGKTVLLKLLRGDLWPTPTGLERRIYRLGREYCNEPREARSRIAYLGPERQDKYQRYEWDLSVRDVVGTGLFDTDIPLDRVDARGRRAVDSALADAGLAGLAARRFLSLSYGQRRRVLLARALARRPDVLLLDEALNGLDTRSRRAFLRQLRRGIDSRAAWILTTHRAADAPREVTHVARLEGGRIVHAGPAIPPGKKIPVRGRAKDPADALGNASDVLPPTAATDLVRLHGVRVYRDERLVIRSLDWTLQQGQHWSVTGPNGSGKSTFIAMLYGDLWPAHGGRIERPSLPAGAPIEDWKRIVGLVSPELQATYAATECTVEEIVVSGLHSSIGLNVPTTSGERALARRALARVGMLGLRGRRARELSYGQLRLALLARAIVAPRRLLLLDEPFDGLDAVTCSTALQVIGDMAARRVQVVLATHHGEDVPDYVRNELAFGRSGRATITWAGGAGDRAAARRGRRARP
jgi:molybdate transport system ATP-binding protein